MHLITIRDQVCNVMASLTKTCVRPDIVLQNLEAITARRLSQLLHAIQHGRVHWPSFRAKGLLQDKSGKKNRIFSSVFDHRPSFRAKGLLQDKSGTRKIAILPQFLTIDPHFVRKGCSGTSPAQEKSQFYLSFWRSTLISCERVAPGQVNSQIYLSFCRSTLISCERVAPAQVKSQFYLSFC